MTKSSVEKNRPSSSKVGQLLNERRNELGITIPQAAERTRIRAEYLQSLERNDYSVFTSETHTKGFLSSYSKFLGLDTNKILAVYRREADIPNRKDSINDTLSHKNTRSRQFTQKSLSIIILGTVALLIIIYIANQVNAFWQPPKLEIISPIPIEGPFDGEIYVAGNSFKIEGKTGPNTVIRLNTQPIQLQSGYEFITDEIPLQQSETRLVITATNQFGRTSTINISVKKGSTGVGTVDKISALAEIINEPTSLLVRSDGVITFNDRAFPGDIIALEAGTRLQVESDTPYNIKLTINGETYVFTTRNTTWELIDGKILEHAQ